MEYAGLDINLIRKLDSISKTGTYTIMKSRRMLLTLKFLDIQIFRSFNTVFQLAEISLIWLNHRQMGHNAQLNIQLCHSGKHNEDFAVKLLRCLH